MKLLFSLLFILNLSACSANRPVVYYNKFDFSQVKKYSFYTADSAFFESQSLNYAQRSRIELAIENKLAERSLHYSELAQADVIVTYHIVGRKRHDYQAYNKVVRFCTHCLKSNLWDEKNGGFQAYPGGLIIDLVNPKNNRSVWRSIAPLKIDIKDNSNKLNEKLIEAVGDMLAQYPS